MKQLFGHGTITGLSEEQLLDRFAAARDESAFEALVKRHGPMVLGVCRQFLRDPNRQKDLLGNWLYGVACRAV